MFFLPYLIWWFVQLVIPEPFGLFLDYIQSGCPHKLRDWLHRVIAQSTRDGHTPLTNQCCYFPSVPHVSGVVTKARLLRVPQLLLATNQQNTKTPKISNSPPRFFVESFCFMHYYSLFSMFLYEKTSPAGLKLVLDFVFNHCGKRANVVQEALADKESPYRNFFFLSPSEAGSISSDRQEHTVDGRNPANQLRLVV